MLHRALRLLEQIEMHLCLHLAMWGKRALQLALGNVKALRVMKYANQSVKVRFARQGVQGMTCLRATWSATNHIAQFCAPSTCAQCSIVQRAARNALNRCASSSAPTGSLEEICARIRAVIGSAALPLIAQSQNARWSARCPGTVQVQRTKSFLRSCLEKQQCSRLQHPLDSRRGLPMKKR